MSLGKKRDSTYEVKKIKEIGENLRKWVASPQGKKEIEEALQSTSEYTSKFREDCKVDPNVLRQSIIM